MLTDFEKIKKLIETYCLVEKCYRSIEEELNEPFIDIESLSYAQINVLDLISDIIGLKETPDTMFDMFNEIDIEDNPETIAQQVINEFKET